MHRNFALSLLAATLILSSGNCAIAEDSAATPAAATDAAAKSEEKTSDKVDKTKDKVKDKKDKSADKAATKEPEKADAKPVVKKEKTKKAGGSGDGIGSIPAHIASFAVGTMVGIPVSMFRKSKTETVNATKDLVGDTDNKFLLGAAGVLGVPAGVLSGTIQGFFFGPKNAWKGTADEPFSEEAFSLGDSK